MQTISLSDAVYESLRELADERNVTPEQLLANLLAQERWEEHAARAYDAYHAGERETHEALTEDEFLASLRESQR